MIAGTLFTALCGVVAAVWRSVKGGEWVPKDEHLRLREDRDWWRAQCIKEQEANARLSQTNAVAVGRLTQAVPEPASRQEPTP